MSEPISRRDFLKIAGLGAAAIAFKKPIEGLARAAERRNIDTQYAKYFPFYEEHTIGISFKEVRQIESLDIFFHEGIIKTDLALKNEPLNVLNAVGTLPGVDDKPRFFPKDNLRYFADNKIDISIENVGIDPKIFELSDGVLNTERITSMLAFMEEGVRLFYKGIKKDLSKNQVITYPLSASYWLWAMSPRIMEDMLTINESVNTESDEKELLPIHEFVQRMHPEDITVSLRNVFMARRLQVLGKDMSEKKGRKANIAFEVGKSHSGIERFLELGEDVTIKTLDIYPDWLIKNIVEYNSGNGHSLEEQINIFCSVISIPVKEILEGGGYNKIVIDEKMRNYLKARLLYNKPKIERPHQEKIS